MSGAYGVHTDGVRDEGFESEKVSVLQRLGGGVLVPFAFLAVCVNLILSLTISFCSARLAVLLHHMGRL